MFSFTYFGYAAVYLQFEKRILFDPGIIAGQPLVDPNAVPVSYILVTQTSTEHFGNAINFANDKGSVILSNSQICDFAQKQGAHGYALAPLSDRQTMEIGGNIKITGYHLQRAGFLAPHNMAFLVEGVQGSVLYLGHAREYHHLTGLKPDLLCVPIGGKKKSALNPEEAVDATNHIFPRYVLPIGGSEQQLSAFFTFINEEALKTSPISLPIGESYTII